MWSLNVSTRTFALLAVALLGVLAAAPPPAESRGGMVAADHRLASAAGAEILAAGGSAVDAAVAAALAAGVVQPAGSGLGGGGFAVWSDGARSQTLDFREIAPAGATREMFQGDPAPSSRKGGLAVAVPGEGPGLESLHAAGGRLPLRVVAQPAIDLARRGFSTGWLLEKMLLRAGERAPALSRALFDAESVPRRGDVVRRQALARTLSAFARSGARALTAGPIADDVAEAVRAAGGVLTTDDLAEYAPTERAPLVGRYRGWTVTTMPPPSSGGVALLQVLAVLEMTDVAALGSGSADHLHLLAEAFKHAFADRARHMGDPERATVPVDALLSEARIEDIRRSIFPSRTFGSEHYGAPFDIGRDGGTQHISVIDAAGAVVSLTTTINLPFGSEVVAPRSGILLNDQMDDFVARPGEPNAYGLVGSEANAVAPGARPLSSMTPAVLEAPDGRRIAIGASGGPRIITAVAQVIVNLIDFGLDPSAAVARPRIHHQWVPDTLFVDEEISADTTRALIARGHALAPMPAPAAVQVVVRDGEGVVGASDPRKDGWPAGG